MDLSQIRDRIIDLRRVPASELVPHPNNFRRHTDVQRAGLRAMLQRVGFAGAVLVRKLDDGRLQICDGHLRRDELGDRPVPVLVTDLTEDEARQVLATYDPLGMLAETDEAALRALLESCAPLPSETFDALYPDGLTVRPIGNPDAVPPLPKKAKTRLGDRWLLGEHSLLCGDTTDPAVVDRLVGTEPLVMLHADPPYGMGKEADGIANDNLYDEKLDAFQMSWWRAWAGKLAPNGSAYVWGTAPDLWRLWYRGGLSAEPGLLVRNELVWDKGSVPGMASEGAHSYPPATERCLFLMRGQQFLGNQNKADYWDGYEPLRAWLEAERDRAGWSNSDVNKMTKTQMAGHWFSKSQFAPISREHYATLRERADGWAFAETYDQLFGRLFPEVKDGGNAHRRSLAEKVREGRSYFDGAHDAMTDVWNFPRVVGEERYEHATPKPVAMAMRALRSSSDQGDAIGVPFCGTGPEIIAAEQLGRRCFAVEVEPLYCDLVVERWQKFTGKKAKRQ